MSGKRRKRCLMCGKVHKTRAALDACFARYTALPPSKPSGWFDTRGAYEDARRG